jgi:histidinol-phosphatase (PHP family)
MQDYHLHLWTHEDPSTWLVIDQLSAYCEAAKEQGVVEIAITEHLSRFSRTIDLVGPIWEDNNDSPALKQSMAAYFDFHARGDLDAYVELVLEAKRQGLPIKLGMEVDYMRDKMDAVADMLADYPFDVLLGSVHWMGSWMFDVVEEPVHLDEWDRRSTEQAWDAYVACMEELAATKSCDVLAHPDVIKIAGRIPDAPEEWWDRIAEAAAKHASVVELSSAGWRKPVGEQYPALGLLERFVARGVQFTTASDAHRVDQVADHVPEMRSLLLSQGVDQLVRFSERKGHALAIEEAH